MFSTYQSWGIAGVKYGLMTARGVAQVRRTIELLQTAAQYQLLVNIHDDPMPPSGIQRTYPNLVAIEYGYGQLDGAKPTPAQWANDDLPTRTMPRSFLRHAFLNMVSGPMDMNPGFFALDLVRTNGALAYNVNVGPIPSTVANEVARVLITETGLRVLPDAPEEYARKDAMFEFIRNLPAKYDETRVLDAEYDEKLSLARRAGDEWFVGSVASNDGANIDISLDFLTPGVSYGATLYEDAAGTTYETNRDGYNVRQTTFTSTDTVTHDIPAGGGQAIWLQPVRDPMAHWPMENNANDATGDLHGTVTGGAGFDTADAKEGSAALSLDGTDDWVDLSAHEASFPLGNSARSLVGWFKADTETSQGPSFFHYGSGGAGRRFAITADWTEVSVAVDGHKWGVKNLGLDDGWHHVAVTYVASGDSDDIRIYLDGVLQSAATLNGSPRTIDTRVGGDAGIGRTWEGTVYYDGKIDGVRLYNFTLTQAEVTNLYNNVNSSPPLRTAAKLTKPTARLPAILPRSSPDTGALSSDASLGALRLSGVNFGAFDSAVTDYAAAVAHDAPATEVMAVPADDSAVW